jgi:hypothetical protein
MSLTNARSIEPLYIVIVREQNAQQLLQEWAKSAGVNVTIESNRMKIFESRSFDLFNLSWPHSWDQVTIWDCWRRQHIHN